MNPNSMTPVDWAKRPIVDKYADFNGRAPRAEYWWFVLAIVIVAIVLSIVESILGVGHLIGGVYGPLTALLFVGTVVPSLAVAVRRLHDTNRPGMWVLLWLVPWALMIGIRFMYAGAGALAMAGMMGLIGLISLVCGIVLLVFMVLPGQPGANQYGPNPYGETGGAVAAE